MKYWTFSIFLVAVLGGMPFVSMAASKDIIISEVLFNPAGTDTGQEYVALKNIGTTTENLLGWQLYPDGVGYFTFPAITLTPASNLTIFIHGVGTNTSHDLYFSNASGNLGNSSGSIALFSSSSHASSTIVSYIRYQKPGATMHKTWEALAASTRLWTLGSFVDISGLTEGQSIYLKDIAQKNIPTGWGIHDVEPKQAKTESLSTSGAVSAKSSDSVSSRGKKISNSKNATSSSYSGSIQYEDIPIHDQGDFLSIGILQQLGVGVGIALILTGALFVLKTLWTRYNKH